MFDFLTIQLLTKKLVVKINAVKFSLLKFETVRAGELDRCGRPFFANPTAIGPSNNTPRNHCHKVKAHRA